MPHPTHRSVRQSGAAIITAMLILTLTTVVVSSLFYRENVAVRSIENRIALSQTRWVERAVLDWARVILRVDPANYDHGTDVWATPVVETQLDATVTGGADIGGDRKTFLAGSMSDAQARFNLNSLALMTGQPAPESVAAYRRLLGFLGLPESLAESAATRVLQSRPRMEGDKPILATLPPLIHIWDLKDIPGYDENVLRQLEKYLTVLPIPTPVNLNTADPLVVAAVIPRMQLSAAKSFVARRERTPVTTIEQASELLALPQDVTLNRALVSVNTSFFLVDGVIRFDRVESQTRALIRRDGSGRNAQVQVVWQIRN